MICTLLVPPDGLLELFNYDKPGTDVLTERGHTSGLVRIDLAVDGRDVGKALFTIVGDHPRNTRATDIIAYLSGAYVQVDGPMVLEGLGEQAAIEIMRDVVR